jgi:hypothetical protein
MRERLIRLAERRALLQERARTEREKLAELVARSDEWSKVLAGVGRVADELRRQPWIAAAGVALLAALWPRRALGWAMRGWTAWRVLRGAQRWWARLRAA